MIYSTIFIQRLFFFFLAKWPQRRGQLGACYDMLITLLSALEKNSRRASSSHPNRRGTSGNRVANDVLCRQQCAMSMRENKMGDQHHMYSSVEGLRFAPPEDESSAQTTQEDVHSWRCTLCRECRSTSPVNRSSGLRVKRKMRRRDGKPRH